MDLIQTLLAVDHDIKRMLMEADEPSLVDKIVKMLEKAAETPGRGAKLRATYLLERMAEIVKDLENSQGMFAAKCAAFMRWIDRGLTRVTYLTNPDSQGKFMESFDQIVTDIAIPGGKDPAEDKQRRKQAGTMKNRWDDGLKSIAARRSQASEPRRPAGNLIVPGSA